MRTLQSITLLLLAFLGITLISPNSAIAQLDSCSPHNEAQCYNDSRCHYCPVENVCKRLINPCIECVDLSEEYCGVGVGCYWCRNKDLCLPDEESCTCGDGFLQNTLGEECDSGTDCREDCTCPDNYVPDGWAGCQTDPEIRIKGNNRIIEDDDLDPRPIDHTDFGNILVNGGSQTRTYTIENDDSGNFDLILSGNPVVVVEGANPTDFTVTTQPDSTVAVGGSVTFTVTFQPSATGLRRATVSIGNNDADESPYNFAIQGTGMSPTVIDLISFTATDENGYVELAWETASEIETAGFHLWRSSPGNEEYVRITTSLIPAEGETSWGAEYTYADNDVASRGTYYYVLEDIDYHGVSTFHEPVSIVVAGKEIILLSPVNNAKIPNNPPATFEWEGGYTGQFKLQFSKKPDFSSRIITLPRRKKANRWITDTVYTPRKREWHLIRRLGGRGKTIYWRVCGSNGQGGDYISNTQGLVVERR